MDHLSPRYARVLHTVTVELSIDLDERDVYQVVADHTAPLRALALAHEGEDCPALTPEEEKAALEIATSSDAWPAWLIDPDRVLWTPADRQVPPFTND